MVNEILVEGRRLQRRIRPGKGAREVERAVSVAVSLLADRGDRRRGRREQGDHLGIGQLIEEVVPGEVLAVNSDGAGERNTRHLIQLHGCFAVHAVGAVRLRPCFGDIACGDIPRLIGIVDALLKAEIFVVSVKVVVEVHAERSLLQIDDFLFESQIGNRRRCGERSVHVRTAEDGHARFFVNVHFGADGVVDVIGVREERRHFVFRIGVQLEMDRILARDGKGSLVVHPLLSGNELARAAHRTERVCTGIELPAGMTACIRVVIVEGSNVLHVDLDNDSLAPAGQKNVCLFKPDQFNVRFFDAALDVRRGRIDLDRLLACDLARVGYRHRHIQVADVCRIADGGSKLRTVARSGERLRAIFVGIDAAHLKGEIGIREAVTEGINNVEFVPFVRRGLVRLAVSLRVDGESGVAHRGLVPIGLVILISEVDALFVVDTADAADARTSACCGREGVVPVRISVHEVTGNFLAVRAVTELTTRAVVHPGRIRSEVAHILGRMSAGRIDLAAEDLRDGGDARFLNAGTAEPKHRVDRRILLQVIALECVRGVEHDDHFVKIALHIIDERDLGSGQLQIMLDFDVIFADSRRLALFDGRERGVCMLPAVRRRLVVAHCRILQFSVVVVGTVARESAVHFVVDLALIGGVTGHGGARVLVFCHVAALDDDHRGTVVSVERALDCLRELRAVSVDAHFLALRPLVRAEIRIEFLKDRVDGESRIAQARCRRCNSIFAHHGAVDALLQVARPNAENADLVLLGVERERSVVLDEDGALCHHFSVQLFRRLKHFFQRIIIAVELPVVRKVVRSFHSVKVIGSGACHNARCGASCGQHTCHQQRERSPLCSLPVLHNSFLLTHKSLHLCTAEQSITLFFRMATLQSIFRLHARSFCKKSKNLLFYAHNLKTAPSYQDS